MKPKQIGFTMVLPLVLLCFFAFWLGKVNGYFDYSHKYHIRSFESERDTENLASMLDGEPLTVWGDLSFWGEETVPRGEELTIIFDGSQTVSGLTMQGKFPAKLTFYAVSSNGEGEMELVPLQQSLTEDVFTVTFAPTETEAIRIAVTESKPGDKWYIGELSINE